MKIVETSGNKHDQVVETKFITAKAFFDNTTSFRSTNGVFYDNTEGEYFPVFTLLFSSQLLSFRLFAGILTVTYLGLCPKILCLATRLSLRAGAKDAHRLSFYREQSRQTCVKAIKSAFEPCITGCFSRYAFFLPL
jgi:hypothetical protein